MFYDITNVIISVIGQPICPHQVTTTKLLDQQTTTTTTTQPPLLFTTQEKGSISSLY